jgi:hypothetical protein
MQKRTILQVEQLEQRDVPSCAGLEHALSSPGAEHRSENATDHLQANLAAQCSFLQTIGGGTSHVIALATPVRSSGGDNPVESISF